MYGIYEFAKTKHKDFYAFHRKIYCFLFVLFLFLSLNIRFVSESKLEFGAKDMRKNIIILFKQTKHVELNTCWITLEFK